MKRSLVRRKPHVTKKGLTIFGVAACLATLPIPKALAQLEQIVVTAQKREQSAEDVGLTLTAFDADTYNELTHGSLEGLAAQLSNVQAYAGNSFLQSLHVRGIGLNEFQGQYDSPVAQHFDEVYVSKPWMVARPQHDLQRVEVLKGPQGTLFGRNTTGGSVNFYTQPPSDTFGARVELGVDEYERYRTQGMVTGPLKDNLSGRLSLLLERGSGGPQDNLFTGEQHGAPDLYDVRGQLLRQGTKGSLRALIHGGKDRGEKVAWKGPGIFNFGSPGYCPEVLAGTVSTRPSACSKFAGFATAAGSPEGEYEPEDIFTINQNTPPDVDDTFYGGYLRLDRDAGWAELTSITAYEYYERIHREDSQSDIFDSSSTHYYDEMAQISQELRLTRSRGDRRHQVLGLFYEHDALTQVDGSDLSEQPLPGITPVFADQFFAQFGLAAESIALFGNQELGVADRVTLNLGARYSFDTIEVNDALLGIGNLPQVGKERLVTPCLITNYSGGPIGSLACPFLGPTAPPFSGRRSDRDFSWRVGLEWRLERDALLYANLSTGYRNGGFSLPLAGAVTEFEPEDLRAQEIGVKKQWPDRAVQLAASVFGYVYDDVQVNVDDPVSPLVPVTRNVGEQRSVGAEIEVDWAPNQRWYVRQSLGRLDATYRNTDRAISTYAGIVRLDGKRPVNSPEWTYSGFVRHQRPIGLRDVSIGFDYRWIDERFLEATNQPFDAAEAYAVVNLRAAIASRDGSWEVAAYVTNLFDQEYLTYVNNFPFFKLDIFGPPRTYVATATFRFGQSSGASPGRSAVSPASRQSEHRGR